MKRIIFDVPKWTIYQHRSSRGIKYAEQEDGPRLRFEDELFDRLYSGEPEKLPLEEDKKAELREWAKKIHSACDALPAFQRLAEECRGDPDAAGSATEELVGQLGPQLEQEPGKVPPAALRRTLGSACERASSAVEAQREAAEAFQCVSWGTGRCPSRPGSLRWLRRRNRDCHGGPTRAAAGGRAPRHHEDGRLGAGHRWLERCDWSSWSDIRGCGMKNFKFNWRTMRRAH